MFIPSIIRFWLFLIVVIPSSFCILFNLYYFLVDRTLRQGLNNHVIIIILIFDFLYNIFNIIWLTYFYYMGDSLSLRSSFCLIWLYIDYTGYLLLLLLAAWGSIERHILIFNKNIFLRKKKRFLFHYFPIIIIIIYSFFYCIIIYFFRSSVIAPNYVKSRCNLTYYTNDTSLIGIWDSLINNILPTLIIVIFSLTLLLRVWYRKYRMGQRFHWRNYKKLTIQSLSISVIYIILYFPSIILNLAYTIGLSSNIGADLYSSTLYLSYFVGLFIPFLSMVSLPELRAKFKKLFRFYRRATPIVAPQILPMNHLDHRRIVGKTHLAK
ncbi:unnamed protein product [Adineta steineri]|uniref:G-protein coupled receptors family 1 profile domain-containing protein n=3 Tax=Adineta steineri TaxID=433720 RepID=A0A814R779_9BILA|nr:unnamed protein product [Adineta steineri]CAF3983006.1 unnamed protein product [Adineta steineri]